jgi:hypothetical protein
MGDYVDFLRRGDFPDDKIKEYLMNNRGNTTYVKNLIDFFETVFYFCIYKDTDCETDKVKEEAFKELNSIFLNVQQHTGHNATYKYYLDEYISILNDLEVKANKNAFFDYYNETLGNLNTEKEKLGQLLASNKNSFFFQNNVDKNKYIKSLREIDTQIDKIEKINRIILMHKDYILEKLNEIKKKSTTSGGRRFRKTYRRRKLRTRSRRNSRRRSR